MESATDEKISTKNKEEGFFFLFFSFFRIKSCLPMNVQIESLLWCWNPLMFCPCMSQPGSYMLRHCVSKAPVTATFLAVCPSGGS